MIKRLWARLTGRRAALPRGAPTGTYTIRTAVRQGSVLLLDDGTRVPLHTALKLITGNISDGNQWLVAVNGDTVIVINRPRPV